MLKLLEDRQPSATLPATLLECTLGGSRRALPVITTVTLTSA
ncbi:hypothetical protein [Deinococcus marmoris]|nr:hypothetical protein [Deinococcus marmoris]